MVYGKSTLHDHVCSSCGDRIRTCRNNPECQESNNKRWEACKMCQEADYQWTMRSSTSWTSLSLQDRRAIKSIVAISDSYAQDELDINHWIRHFDAKSIN